MEEGYQTVCLFQIEESLILRKAVSSASQIRLSRKRILKLFGEYFLLLQ